MDEDRNKRRKWLIVDLIAVAAIAVGYVYTSRASREKASAEARDRLRKGGAVMMAQEQSAAVYRKLSKAVRDDDVDAIKAIIPSQIEANSTTAWNALADAATTGKLKLVKLWLNEGWPVGPASVNNDPQKRYSDLLSRSSCSQNPELVKYLYAKGAKLISPDQGKQCVWMAAQRPNAEVVELFLLRGANPNVADTGHGMYRDKPNPNPRQHHPLDRDHFGWTPLMWASIQGHSAVVKVLLRYGADPTMKSPGGDTARSLALERGHDDIVKLLDAAAKGPAAGP